VKSAKTPLLAGGAALAGLAGAIAARAATNGRSKGRMSKVKDALPKLSPDKDSLKGGARNLSQTVSDAAQQADKIGQRVSSVANAIQRVSETADKAAKKA
jgi:methyl-accepting chemotaxis protein